MRTFKNKIIFGLILTLALPSIGQSQVYSQNIVGYYNKVLYVGQNLIANQLSSGLTNTINILFSLGIPNGATFTKWDAGLRAYQPVSTYSVGTGWSIDYSLTYGEGGLLTVSETFTNVFVGGVWSGYQENGTNFGLPELNLDGVYLLSCLIPINQANFYQFVRRNPLAGEYVTQLDSQSQLWKTTFFDGNAWDNGAPILSVGEAAFFGLGDYSISQVPEPEPGILILVGCSLVFICRYSSKKFRAQTPRPAAFKTIQQL